MLAKQSAYVMSGYTGHCAVTAVHEVAQADWSADDVMAAAKENGFPYSRAGGWDVKDIEAGMRTLGVEFHKMFYGDVRVVRGEARWGRGELKPTLAQFARAHSTGVHIVIMKGHAAVIREGRIIDPNWVGRRAARRRVWISYRIENAGPGKYAPAQEA